MITLRVGTQPNQQDFLVNETLLTGRSEFFRRAMQKNWLEAELRKVDFPEDKPEIFKVYLNQVYTNRLPTSDSDQEYSPLVLEDFYDCLEKEYSLLVDVYVLVEKLQDITTKNSVITAIVEVARLTSANGEWLVPPRHSVITLYEGTPEGSLARRLLVDLWSSVPFETCFRNVLYMPKQFVKDRAGSLDSSCGLRSIRRTLPNGFAKYLTK